MSKHELDPVSLPPAKRKRPSSPAKGPHSEARALLTFDNSIYDELILCIFSHLSWSDLCAAQATSRKWARLASDSALWRKEYLATFGRPRLRGSRGFIARSDRREVKPLPGRVNLDEHKDWKWMFRISANWKSGRCQIEDVPVARASRQQYVGHERSYQTHVLLAGPLTIVSSSEPAATPQIHVTGLGAGESVLIPCASSVQPTSHITTMAMDQSPPSSNHIRTATFLSTGEFFVHNLNHNQPTNISAVLRYKPSSATSRTAPIIKAVYHHPLLVTLSQSFTLSIYDLSDDSIRHTQSLTSFTSFPPTSLVLSTPSNSTYKLVMAYAIPVYPAHWSVGATELIIEGPSIPQPCASGTSMALEFSETPSMSHPSMTVRHTRSIRSIDVPQGWIDERKLRVMREQWGRKVSQIADTQTDGKWVVLAPGDQIPYLAGYTPPQPHGSLPSGSPLPGGVTSSPQLMGTPMKASPMQSETGLQLYRLSLPPRSSSVSASPPKLTFVRTLHGQTGPVSCLALADGRCVSLSHNGSIWVWDLENGTGAEVAARDDRAIGTSPEPQKGTVVFDDRRIISALSNNVVVRRFDI